jgi:hypothetical protein
MIWGAQASGLSRSASRRTHRASIDHPWFQAPTLPPPYFRALREKCFRRDAENDRPEACAPQIPLTTLHE